MACEFPPDFDWQDAMKRVRALQPELEQVMGMKFELDENVQDASFFTQLAVYEPQNGSTTLLTILGFRFSAFGNLFTAYSSTELDLSDLVRACIARTEDHGFIYVSTEDLAEPYDGPNEGVKAQPNADWWLRYFDHL